MHENKKCEGMEVDRLFELEPISPRGLTSDKSKLEKRTQKSKLRGKIKQEKEAGKFLKGVIIPVRVTLNFDTDVELKFEEQIKKNFGDAVKYERVKPREYELIVNTDQLAALEKMDEVLLINEPGEKNEASIGGFIAEDEASVGLNAASEMLGAKKARIDFGVTGDLDGDETDYSSDADLNITFIITDEGMEDLDLVIWEPGADPYAGDPSTYYINEEDDLPQESFSISSPEEGLYYICVWGRNDAADYTLEITGHEIQPQ